MSSNKNKLKLSMRFQVALIVFVLLFMLSSILIVAFHILVTTRSFDNVLINPLGEVKNQQNIIDLTKEVVTKKVWNSLGWVLIANALTDVVIAYAVSIWLSRPVESLLSGLKNAYKQGVPYSSFEDKKFAEIREISDVVSDMTTKYIDALDLQNLFIQDISHELKTPLAAIKSTGDLINLNENPTIDDYKYYFQTSQLMTARMITLVNQLTVSNKSDVEIYDEEDINLSNLVKDIIKTHSSEIEAKKLKIHFDIENDIYIKGSIKYISTAITNILDNAIKYSDKENGVVEITLGRKRGNVILEITDQGIGISESDMKNIFNRFYRGENTQEVNGTGLGLSISRKIIKAHNGKIIMRSKLDFGSQVKIIF